MEMMKTDSILKRYSDITTAPVEWLWYPYIPYGKITLVQGDPGVGKSTMILDLVSRISRGGATPDGSKSFQIQKVIYQCSEDGRQDTIKPRLEASGANCNNIAFIDEDVVQLTLDSSILRDAISEFKARLLVIDPFQAYVNTDADISSAVKARKIMQQLNIWASTFNCAIVLVGHLTKGSVSNELYRGLGSIDVAASARSVLQVYKNKEELDLIVLHHVKSNLAPIGSDSEFRITKDRIVDWVNCVGQEPDMVSDAVMIDTVKVAANKVEMISAIMVDRLKDGPVEASVMDEFFNQMDVSRKTIMKAKHIVGVKSKRKAGKWYWQLENYENTE